MTENRTTATVFFGKEPAGRLTRIQRPDGKSDYEFEYVRAYLDRAGAMPVSLSLPLRKEKFTSGTLFPFFEGLLPEGWLLDLMTRELKIDKSDKFTLLLHTGTDTIGAVTVRVVDES